MRSYSHLQGRFEAKPNRANVFGSSNLARDSHPKEFPEPRDWHFLWHWRCTLSCFHLAPIVDSSRPNRHTREETRGRLLRASARGSATDGRDRSCRSCASRRVKNQGGLSSWFLRNEFRALRRRIPLSSARSRRGRGCGRGWRLGECPF